MIVQTQASILTRLMATDCHQEDMSPSLFIDAVQDALLMAREYALDTRQTQSVSNDRTTLKHHL